VSAPLILVVDDDPEVRPLAAGILKDAGYCVLEAADGAQAFRMLHRHPEIALLFTDVVMPGIDGVALAARAKAMRPTLKVLYATGYSEAISRRRAALHGDVLPKPYKPTDLAAWVRAALGTAADTAAGQPRAGPTASR
jgi:CheY-like chemotaxis protein